MNPKYIDIHENTSMKPAALYANLKIIFKIKLFLKLNFSGERRLDGEGHTGCSSKGLGFDF